MPKPQKERSKLSQSQTHESLEISRSEESTKHSPKKTKSVSEHSNVKTKMDTKVIRTRARFSRDQQKAPTIHDVAREAECSPMTVSRVVNNDQYVRPSMRAVVKDAIAKLNYSPNIAARSLASSTQLRIALLYSNPSNAYLSEFLIGGVEQAGRSDVQFIVEKCKYGFDEEEVIHRLISSGINGLILTPPLCDKQPLLDMLLNLGMPAVVVGIARPPEFFSTIGIDDFSAASEMTKHLIDLGHRRIGFIVGHPQHSASQERLRGFRSAMDSAEIEIATADIVQGYFTYRSGLEAATKLLDQPEAPTAIFASNDDMAAATIAVAHRRHLEVPGDLTVCGFDDTFIASTIWPELTTIQQPIAEMSRAAVEMLTNELRALRSGPFLVPQHKTLSSRLIRRQSDAVPTLDRLRDKVR